MANLDEDIYISVTLDEYLELKELRDFFDVLRDFGIEEWEEFDAAVEAFLEEDDTRDDPRDPP